MKTSLAVAAAIAGVDLLAPVTRADTTYTWDNFSSTQSNFAAGSNWAGGVAPVSGPATALVFPNSDANGYDAGYLNLSNQAFELHSITFDTFTTTISTTTTEVSSAYNTPNGSMGSFQLGGSSPQIIQSGPSVVSFGTFNGSGSATGFGLSLAPGSGSTTVTGWGVGSIYLAGTTGATTTTAGITGTGGLTINESGGAYTYLLSPASGLLQSNFTGPVTLDNGGLFLDDTGSLGSSANPLIINGGNLGVYNSVVIPNLVQLNSDVTITTGYTGVGYTSVFSGTIQGSGGVHVVNYGTSHSGLAISGSCTYSGATTIDQGPVRGYGTSTTFVITLQPTGSIANTAGINIGQGGTLYFNSSNGTQQIPTNGSFNLSGGTVLISGMGSATNNFSQTAGRLNATSCSTFSLGTLGTPGFTANLTFSGLSRTDNATLFFAGGWQNTTGISSDGNSTQYGTATFTNTVGLEPVVDPAGLNASHQPVTPAAILPFASGNDNSLTALTPVDFVTYGSGGITLIPATDSQVVQMTGSGAQFGDTNDFVNNIYDTSDANVNLDAGVGIVTDAETVSALITSGTNTLQGSGTLRIYTGALLLGGNTTFAGPNLEFGSTTGYIHLGGTANMSAGSINGSGGLVVSSSPSAYRTLFFTNNGNTFTGGLFVNNANVAYTGDSQLGAPGGAVNLSSGMLIWSNSSSGVLARPLNIDVAGGGVAAATGDTITVTSNITGTGAFAVNSGAPTGSAGTTILAGTNTYSGPTYIFAGTLDVSSDINLGKGAVTVSGGTLQFGASNSYASPFAHNIVVWGSLASQASIIDTQAYSVYFGGTISGSLGKIGSGTLTILNSQPAYGGLANVSSGVLALSYGGALPQATGIVVSSGAEFRVDDSVPGYNLPDRVPDLDGVSLAGASRTANGGMFSLIGSSTSSTTETISGLALASVGNPVVNVVNGTGQTAVLTANGAVTGSGTLTKMGSGTLLLTNLNGTSTYTGGTQISGGTLCINSDAQLGAAYTGSLGAGVSYGGTGYQTSGYTTVTINGGGGTYNASGTKAQLFNGAIYSITLSQTAGYIAPVTLTIGAPPAGSGANQAAGVAYVVGLLELDSGTLRTTSGVTSPRAVSLSANGGTIDTDGQGDLFTGIVNGPGSLNIASGSVGGNLNLSGTNIYTGATNVLSGMLTIGATGALPAGTNFNIAAGASAYAVNLGSAYALQVDSLIVNGKLDLNNNAMVVHNPTSTTLLHDVSALVASGFNSGGWNGTIGIVSSAASGKPLMALGAIVNDNGSGQPLYGSNGSIAATFDGSKPVEGDVLVKYTYYGDSNLDGKVDGSDYSRIDNGYLNGLSGWGNGDFNYDGVVNGSDYTLIDNAYNMQGSVIADQIAAPTAQLARFSAASSVPDPAGAGLIWLTAAGLLGRRSRNTRS